MNDKLEDLLYQSGLTAQGCWDELDDYAKQGIEKLAELIVKECASVAFRFSIDNKRIHPDINSKDMPEANQMVYHSTCQVVGFEIREHFGVEE
jgi:hypothetical protein